MHLNIIKLIFNKIQNKSNQQIKKKYRKLESQDISDHYEIIITDLRAQIKCAATKIEELTEQQNKVAILKNELMNQVNEEKKVSI